MIRFSAIHRRQLPGRRQGAALQVLLVLLLTGCNAPVEQTLDLYHGLQGGPIAEQRPPPPGFNDPYPNLGTTPARPLAADVAAQQRIGDTLAAQRDAATLAAAKDPLTVAPPPPRLPPKPPAPDPNGNKVVVDAAPAPPAPPPPPPPAAASPGPGIDSVAALQPQVAVGPLPEFAAAPPPLPTGLESFITLPPATPPIVAAVSAPLPAGGIKVPFTPGSATLPPSATLVLRRFVIAHRGVAMVVTGHGDRGPQDADSQSRALALALKRAAAIALSLGGAGVPPGNIKLRADATAADSTATLN